MEKEFDICIIGGGMAGCTAAIYAGMSGKSVVLFMGNLIGGLISTTKIVDNYPGLMDIDGMELAGKIEAHAAKYCTIIYDSINNIDLGQKIVHSSLMSIKSKAIIVATGSSPKKLHLKSEYELENKGISYCAICDGFLFKNKNVAVIGGGNSAFEHVKYLSGLGKTVYLIHRNDKFRAFSQLQEDVKNLPNVIMVLNEEVEEFIGLDCLTGIKLKNSAKILDNIDGCFISIGHTPNSSFIDVEKHDNYIVVNKKYETSCPGIFAAGDVIHHDLMIRYKQAVVASSEGCIAALEAVNYVDSF